MPKFRHWPCFRYSCWVIPSSLPGPTIIAHRGVPGSRLEHTRPSYLLAIEQGAEYIEPDVVASRDGVLIVRHENEIHETTDVASRVEFSSRRTTKFIDGVPYTGWFTEDFTLEELKTLRTVERLPQLRPQNIGLSEKILTLDEVLNIAEDENFRRGPDAVQIGVYIETKHPTYFRGIGLDLNDLLIANLERRRMNHLGAKIMIQSMETANLRSIRSRTPLPLIQLFKRGGAPFDLTIIHDPRTYESLTTSAELAIIAEYADGIGPNKSLVIGRDEDYRLSESTGLVRRAHELGLLVHVWTMRNENNFLPTDLRLGLDVAHHGDANAEYLAFFDEGVDGVFSDFTASAVAARDMWLEQVDEAVTAEQVSA